MTSFEQANEEKKLSHEEPFTIQIHYKSPNLNRDQGNVSLSQPKCLICYNEFPANELFSSLKCNHIVCKQCCKAYIESKMESFQVLDIECPQEGCTETISDNDIKELLDTNRYNRYQKLLLLKTIQKSSISHVCPRPGCARPIKLKEDNDKNKYITCKCGTQICKECFSLHHPSKSCLQSLDPDFESYIQQNDIRYCPMCKTPVIRVGVCNNMICCVCDYEWCWACGKHRGSEHVCTGSWDPVPSDIYRSWLQVLGSKLRAFGSGLLEVIAIPFQLLYNAIFWPLFFARATDERCDRPLPEESTSQIVCQYVICGTVGLVLLPITLVVGTVAVICDLPQLVRGIRQEYDPPRVAETPRRWEAGNANIFGYTVTSRPQDDIQAELQALRVFQESQEERSNKKNC